MTDTPGAGGVAVRRTDMGLTTPAPFDFTGTAHSHGWCVLAPTRWESESGVLQRVERLSSGRVVLLQFSQAPADGARIVVSILHAGDLLSSDLDEIKDIVVRVFRLGEDLSEFYALCAERGEPWSRLTKGHGRLLCSPTVFEDVVKTISTTNIQWGGTKAMVQRLVDGYGDPFPGGPALRAFPTAQAIASTSEAEFSATVRMGYRAPYVYTLARQVAEGAVDLEAMRDPGVPTPDLRKQLLALKGIGPYGAATMLMLLGRYDDVAIDTEFRALVTRKYFGGNRPTDAEARLVYKPWGRWKYLAFWFDMWQTDTEV